jgi:hypothetical protein
MIKIPYDKIIEKIKEKIDISDKEIEDKINEKLKQLSGLISKEGAAHIIANELGVRLFEQISGRLQIKNILAGMRNVEVTGKVVGVYDVREFNTNGRQGKVGNFIIGDETGTIRVTCWGDIAENVTKLNVNDIVKIISGYAKENNNRVELHTNDKSKIIINPKGETIAEVKETNNFIRKSISDLRGDEDNVELLGTIVQVWEPRFFEVCPECGKRVRQKEENFICEQHNTIKPDYSYFLSLFLDDGTDVIRVVFFRNQLESLINKNKEEILLFKDDLQKFEDVKKQLSGCQIKVQGRTTKNQMFDRIEFLVNRIYLNFDPEEEIKRLEKEVGSVDKDVEESKEIKELDNEVKTVVEEIE